MPKLAAGVRKRKDGLFEKRFSVNGKQYSVYGKTQKEVQEKELARRQEIDQGFISSRNITLDQYYAEWKALRLVKVKQNQLKPATLNFDEKIYKGHISSEIGKTKVREIEVRQIKELQKKLCDQGYKPETVNGAMKVLRLLLNDAMRDEIIGRNPCNSVKLLQITEKATKTYHRALTKDEQKSFMAKLKHNPEANFYYPILAFMLGTGARFGEAGALTWGDIDYKNNVIHITKTISRTENGYLCVSNTPKTEAGLRDIPITKSVKTLLRNHKGDTVPWSSNLVFPGVYGGYMTNGRANAAIDNTLKLLEQDDVHIEHFTTHALRDTFATRYIEAGGTPQTLKTILGHASLEMTMDLYCHVMDDTKQKEMQQIEISI